MFFQQSIDIFRKTATEYLEQVQKLIDNEHITIDMTSYTIFMNLLSKNLKRLVESDGKNQIMKIVGRNEIVLRFYFSLKIMELNFKNL